MGKFTGSFSDYEVKETSIKFNKENEIASTKIGCVGTLNETMDTRTVVKRCEGVVVSSRTRGSGSGTLQLSLHINWGVYTRMYGMIFTDLKDGVYAYGKDSTHEEFTLTAKVLDEDGNIKYLAYPRCVVTTGTAKQITNGGEEVAEIEMDISVFPDEHGNGKYESMESELTDETIKTTWLTNFSYDLVKNTTE